MKQSQVGLHPIESQTRKGYEKEWPCSMLCIRAGVLILSPGGTRTACRMLWDWAANQTLER